MRNLYYDSMPAGLRSEFQIGAEQYQAAEETIAEEILGESLAKKVVSYSEEANKIAQEYLKDLDRLGAFDGVEAWGGR